MADMPSAAKHAVEAIRSWAERESSRRCWDRRGLAQIATSALTERAAPPESLDAASRLSDEAVVVIAAGQQPAYAGGPLFNLNKAAQILALAEQASSAGQAAVAVFWCAGEDHDLGEALHCDLLERDGRIRRLHADAERPGASLRFQPAAAGWHALNDALRDRHGAADPALWPEPEANESLPRWHCRVLERCFPGLVCLEAQDLRPLYRDTLALALARWPAPALDERMRALRDAGRPTPLGSLEQAPLFVDGPDARRPLSPAAAAELFQTDPQALSPGAGLRPALQQAALPVALYCAGPGEIAYHAQLQPIYAALNVPPPLLWPRGHATLLTAWMRRTLASWQLTAEELPETGSLPRLPSHAARTYDLDDLDRAIDALSAQPDADADLRRRIATGQGRLRRERDRLAGSLARWQRQAAQIAPLAPVRDWLHPRGRPQERVLTVAQAIHLGGRPLIHALARVAGEVDADEHRFISLHPSP